MKAGMGQRQSAGQGFAFQARLASVLALPERAYAGLIRDIESDPLFKALRYADIPGERAIRMRRLQQTDLSHRFLELNEGLVAQDTASGAEVEKLLQGKQWLVRAARAMGEETFVRCFIHNEGDLSVDDIARACCLTPEKVRRIRDLITSVDVCTEFFVAPRAAAEQAVSYNTVASLVPKGHDYIIQFRSAHWARGVYDIDYEKIERLFRSGRYADTDRARLKKLLADIELVNIRKSLMGNILTKIIERHRPYFDAGGARPLEPFLQADLARDLGVHPSIVSRAITGRAVETPWGREVPLKSFFPSAAAHSRAAVMQQMRALLDRERADLRAGKLAAPLSDKRIAAELRARCSLTVAPRTVAKYRTLMNIPSAFRRTAS